LGDSGSSCIEKSQVNLSSSFKKKITALGTESTGESSSGLYPRTACQQHSVYVVSGSHPGSNYNPEINGANWTFLDVLPQRPERRNDNWDEPRCAEEVSSKKISTKTRSKDESSCSGGTNVIKRMTVK
jgi:hypothetical protein